MNPSEKAKLRNSDDFITGLVVADMRTVLKDDRAENPRWVLEQFRKLIKAVSD